MEYRVFRGRMIQRVLKEKGTLLRRIAEEIEKRGFKITYLSEDDEYFTINFTHPAVRRIASRKYGENIAVYYGTSTVVYDKKRNKLELNLVSPLLKYCELYLKYCCEDDTCLCRLHLMSDPCRVGLDVIIPDADIEKIKKALDEFLKCIYHPTLY